MSISEFATEAGGHSAWWLVAIVVAFCVNWRLGGIVAACFIWEVLGP